MQADPDILINNNNKKETGIEQTDPILISIKYLSACLKHRHLSWPIPNPREKKRKAAKSPSYWCIRNMHEQFNAFFFTFFPIQCFSGDEADEFHHWIFFYLLIIWSSCHLWNFPQGHLSSIYTGRILQLQEWLANFSFECSFPGQDWSSFSTSNAKNGSFTQTFWTILVFGGFCFWIRN